MRRNERRFKLLRVTGEAILDCFKPGKHCYESSDNSLPEDVEFWSIHTDSYHPQEVILVLYSETFDPILEAGRIPLMETPSYKKGEGWDIDAQRYRWLRSQFAQGKETYIGEGIMSEEELDEYIDGKMG